MRKKGGGRSDESGCREPSWNERDTRLQLACGYQSRNLRHLKAVARDNVNPGTHHDLAKKTFNSASAKSSLTPKFRFEMCLELRIPIKRGWCLSSSKGSPCSNNISSSIRPWEMRSTAPWPRSACKRRTRRRAGSSCAALASRLAEMRCSLDARPFAFSHHYRTPAEVGAMTRVFRCDNHQPGFGIALTP